MANMRQNSVNASKCQKLHRNLHSLCKSLHSLCKVYTICVNENYNYIFCVKQIAKSYSCLYISCINCDVNKNCDLSLGKLPSTLWCFMIIYTADKNLTRPPVAPVAPNINSVYLVHYNMFKYAFYMYFNMHFSYFYLYLNMLTHCSYDDWSTSNWCIYFNHHHLKLELAQWVTSLKGR